MPIGIYWPAPVLQEQKKYAKFLCISMTSGPLKRQRILGTETKTIGKNEIAINASFVFFARSKLSMESLILAQDERWRRA
jgi:hypothetical protein